MSFSIFYNEKNAFLGYKNKKIEKSKNGHFSKGVNPWFWSKNCHFSNFLLLGNIGQKNVFVFDIQEQKSPVLAIKKEVQKVEQLPFFEKG